MLELALKGSKSYWIWMVALLGVIGAGFLLYLGQLQIGLGITGMSRDVSWGFYIANFTYLVGVAAGGVMVVLPYYLHDYKAYGKVTILGEFLAIAALIMCLLFIMVDLGQPMRGLNVFLYPTTNSVLFYDALVLNGYLLINLVVGWNVLEAERNGVHYQKWLKPIIYLSIPFAVSIHTVTAFLYSGLPGRGFWLTAILAPRFLASAFCSGPAIILILLQLMRQYTRLEIKLEAIWKIAELMAYAMFLNLFLLGTEIFKEYYSGTTHLIHTQYLYSGLDGHRSLVPFAWGSLACSVTAFLLFLVPATRRRMVTLNLGCLLIYTGVYIEKGLALVIPGMTPDTLGEIYDYVPTFTEIRVGAGIFAVGFLVFSVLCKAAVPIIQGTHSPAGDRG